MPISEVTNATDSSSCVPGHWVPPILMTGFLLIANILLISMLIAIFKYVNTLNLLIKIVFSFQQHFRLNNKNLTANLALPTLPAGDGVREHTIPATTANANLPFRNDFEVFALPELLLPMWKTVQTLSLYSPALLLLLLSK